MRIFECEMGGNCREMVVCELEVFADELKMFTYEGEGSIFEHEGLIFDGEAFGNERELLCVGIGAEGGFTEVEDPDVV